METPGKRSGKETGKLAGRFAVVGLVNTLVDYALFNLLFYLAETPLIAAHFLSAGTAVLVSFLLNRNWTFAGAKHHDSVWRQFVRHVATAGSAVLISAVVIWLAAFVLPAYLAKLAAIGVSFAWNFLLSRHWVFRAKP